MFTQLDADEARRGAGVTWEELPGGRVRLRQADDEVIELGRASAEELVRKERLVEVDGGELRAWRARHLATVDWDALRRPATGRGDSADVAALKRVARLQEPFRRGDPAGFDWWRQFCACTPAGECADHLRALADEAGGGAGFELLRQAIGTASARTPAAVRERLRALAGEASAGRVGPEPAVGVAYRQSPAWGWFRRYAAAHPAAAAAAVAIADRVRGGRPVSAVGGPDFLDLLGRAITSVPVGDLRAIEERLRVLVGD